jgi:hypothetical protein
MLAQARGAASAIHLGATDRRCWAQIEPNSDMAASRFTVLELDREVLRAMTPNLGGVADGSRQTGMYPAQPTLGAPGIMEEVAQPSRGSAEPPNTRPQTSGEVARQAFG